MDETTILVRNRIIPGAEWIRYGSIKRYADILRKTIPVNFEIYVNSERREFLLNGVIADTPINEWTVIKFEKDSEFHEFMNKITQYEYNVEDFLKLWNLLLFEENPPYTIRKRELGDDCEIRVER